MTDCKLKGSNLVNLEFGFGGESFVAVGNGGDRRFCLLKGKELGAEGGEECAEVQAIGDCSIRSHIV